VRRTLTSTGTAPLSRRPRREPLTRDWFDQHYINNPASIRQIAAIAGHVACHRDGTGALPRPSVVSRY
jgi:hypothetical protein